MMPSSPTAALTPPSAAPAGSLSFRGLWLFSPRLDSLLLGVPLAFTVLAWMLGTLLASPVSGTANRMAIWTAQYLLGNGTHVVLTIQAGITAPAPLERRLQQWFVPVMLTLVLVRLFFVAESPRPGDTPYLDIDQGTPLPHGAMAVLLTVWLGYFGLLFRPLLRSGTASGPKVLYLLTVAVATGLTLVAPSWGNVMLPSLHGLEYYLLSARMLEPREGDPPSRVSRAWVWPLMVLSMLPLLALGVVHLVIAGPSHGTVSAAAADLKSHVVLRGLTTLSLGVVLAHYFSDALIYRFRLPSIRRVMLRRLGFAS
jgi:hypothetical protein